MVVALAQFGIDHAVATLGTAATRDHLQQLYRSHAGGGVLLRRRHGGARRRVRALEQALPLMREGRQAAFLFLPEGEDPDSFVRTRGAEAFEDAMANAMPLSELLFSTLLGEADPATLEGRARIVDRASALVATVPAGAFRTMLADRAAEIGRVAREDFQVLVGSSRGGRARGGDAPRRSGGGRPGGERRVPSLVRQAIHLLLHQPSLAVAAARRKGMIDLIERLDLDGAPLLAELLRSAAANPELTAASFVERYRGHEAGHHLERLAATPHLIEDAEARKAEFSGVLDRLYEQARRQRQRWLKEKERSGALDAAEKEEFLRLLAESGRPRATAANAPGRGVRG